MPMPLTKLKQAYDGSLSADPPVECNCIHALFVDIIWLKDPVWDVVWSRYLIFCSVSGRMSKLRWLFHCSRTIDSHGYLTDLLLVVVGNEPRSAISALLRGSFASRLPRLSTGIATWMMIPCDLCYVKSMTLQSPMASRRRCAWLDNTPPSLLWLQSCLSGPSPACSRARRHSFGPVHTPP